MAHRSLHRVLEMTPPLQITQSGTAASKEVRQTTPTGQKLTHVKEIQGKLTLLVKCHIACARALLGEEGGGPLFNQFSAPP